MIQNNFPFRTLILCFIFNFTDLFNTHFYFTIFPWCAGRPALKGVWALVHRTTCTTCMAATAWQ